MISYEDFLANADAEDIRVMNLLSQGQTISSGSTILPSRTTARPSSVTVQPSRGMSMWLRVLRLYDGPVENRKLPGRPRTAATRWSILCSKLMTSW